MTPMEEAIITCKYALSLGLTALNEHIDMWMDDEVNASGILSYDEVQYIKALTEIKQKLGTEQCLLK
jgi:hypothetical protein